MGGVAAVYYGRPRTTVDVDLVIRFGPGGVRKVHASLTKHGFVVSLDELEAAIRERFHVSVFDERSPYRLDLWHASTPLDEASLARRRRAELFGVKAWIEAPEDLVIAKLVYASRPRGCKSHLGQAKGQDWPEVPRVTDQGLKIERALNRVF